MTLTARLAGTYRENAFYTRVTLRKRLDNRSEAPAFIRYNGRTVSGFVHVYDYETVFFPRGNNANLIQEWPHRGETESTSQTSQDSSAA